MNENFDNNITNAASETVSDTVSGVENAPKKKIGTKIAAVGVGAAVLVGGGGVAAYNLSDYVKNQVKLATLNPQEYYTWVMEENSNTAADSAAEAYEKYLDTLKEGQSASVSLKYEASDDVKNLLVEGAFGTEAADESTQSVIDLINDINSIEIGVNSAVKDNVVTGSVYGSLNDEKLISADVALDYETLGYYFRIPELTEKWLGMDMGAVMDEAYSQTDETAMVSAMLDKLTQNPEEIIAVAELDDLLTRYSTVWNSEIDEVELEKKEKVEIGDIEVEYTVITAEINGKVAYNVVDSILDELKDDKLVKEIVTERLALCTAEEYDTLIEEAASGIESEKESMYESEEAFDLVTYVDPKGVIRGVSFALPDDETSFDFIIGLEDDDVYGEFIVNDGAESVEIILNAVKDGKKYNGEIVLNINGESEGSIEFKDFEIVDEEMGYANGQISFVVPEIDPISFTLESDGKSQDISFALDIEGTDYGKLTLSASADKAKDVSMPDTSNAAMIDLTTGDFDFASYASEEDIKNFAYGLLDKIFGDIFTEEEKTALADQAASAFFEGYNDAAAEDGLDFGNNEVVVDEEYLDGLDEAIGDMEGLDEWQDEYSDIIDDANADENDPYIASSVDAKSGQAYINVMDYAWDAEYWGDAYDSLSYNAGVVTVDKDGTYTVSVTADTDGYRYARTGDASDASMLPDGLDFLSVCIEDGPDVCPDALIKIDSVKIDGVEIPITSKNYTTFENYCCEGVIYGDWYDVPEDAKCIDGDVSETSSSIIDGASVGEWTTIEVTFTVSGV